MGVGLDGRLFSVFHVYNYDYVLYTKPQSGTEVLRNICVYRTGEFVWGHFTFYLSLFLGTLRNENDLFVIVSPQIVFTKYYYGYCRLCLAEVVTWL